MNNSIAKIIFSLCIIPVSCSNGDYSFNKLPHYKADKKIIAQVQEGDILLRQGLGPMSTQIVNVMGEKNTYSHCGIACTINDTLQIIHCISQELSGIDGVQTQSLDDFFCDVADSNVAIIRPVMEQNQKMKFVAEAQRYLAKKIKFDMGFDFDDTTKFYCSELVYYAYLNSTHQNPFSFKTQGKIKLLKFDSFFNQHYFKTIWKAKKTK